MQVLTTSIRINPYMEAPTTLHIFHAGVEAATAITEKLSETESQPKAPSKNFALNHPLAPPEAELLTPMTSADGRIAENIEGFKKRLEALKEAKNMSPSCEIGWVRNGKKRV